MRVAAFLLVISAIVVPACSGPSQKAASKLTPEPTVTPAATPMYASGWVDSAGEPATPIIVHQDFPGSGLAQIEYPAAPNISALAGQVTGAAAAQWAKNSPTLPAPADLQLLLHTTLDALITPSFDIYDKFLTAREAKLMPYLAASADEFHNHNDLGVPSDEWSLFSPRQKAIAFWNAVDTRSARWKDVVLSELRANSGTDTVRKMTGFRGMALRDVYQGPGGPDMHNAWLQSDAPIAHVYLPTILSSGKKGITFFFGYDERSKKWYAFNLWLESFDGRGFAMRI